VVNLATPTQTDPLPFWRYYWTATLPDGRQIPQFDADGNKFAWNKLPDKPVAITLLPFSKNLALKVRAVAKVAALPIAALPVVVEDLGDGLLCGIDERFHTTPTVKCLSCGHTFPFNPSAKAECPACHDKDEWFCADCQANREPLVMEKLVLCPTCKANGKTRGLKRIMKFQISASSMQYDFQHWVRTGGMEFRVTRDRIIVRPYQKPQSTEQTTDNPQQ